MFLFFINKDKLMGGLQVSGNSLSSGCLPGVKQTLKFLLWGFPRGCKTHIPSSPFPPPAQSSGQASCLLLPRPLKKKYFIYFCIEIEIEERGDKEEEQNLQHCFPSHDASSLQVGTRVSELRSLLTINMYVLLGVPPPCLLPQPLPRPGFPQKL